MATTDAQICNLALLRIGSTATIDSLSEATAEAQACSVLFEQHRDALLASFEWPFATRRTTLAALASVERSGWEYAYALPADCLVVRRVWSGLRRGPTRARVPYAIEDNTAARVLLCDEEAPLEIIYTAQIDKAILLPPLFVEALAWSLAGDLAMALSVKESVRDRAMQQAELAKQKAFAAAVNEEQNDPDPEAATVSIRGVSFDRDTWCR